MHKVTAHVRIQTMYGKYRLCSECYNAGHLKLPGDPCPLVPFFGDARDGQPQPHDTLYTCECEHEVHTGGE